MIKDFVKNIQDNIDISQRALCKLMNLDNLKYQNALKGQPGHLNEALLSINKVNGLPQT